MTIPPSKLSEMWAKFSRDLETAELAANPSKFNTTLTAGIIAYECSNYLWLSFRWMFKDSPKSSQIRIRQRERQNRAIIINTLNEAGYKYKECSPIFDHNGNFSASPKGIIEIEGLPFLIDFKSNGTGSAFNQLERGIEQVKPIDYGALCVEGVLTGIPYAVYINTNRNDESRFIQFVELNLDKGAALIEEAKRIIYSNEPLEKISDSVTFYKCKACAAFKQCHKEENIEINCRSCKYSKPPNDSSDWYCENYETTIPKEFMLSGCENHKSILK